MYNTNKISLETDPWDLAGKIEKNYRRYGVNISITDLYAKSDRVILKSK